MSRSEGEQGDRLALWVLTQRGLGIARQLAEAMPRADVHAPERLTEAAHGREFDRLLPAVRECFHHYGAHVFVMSTGIVVRAIAPVIEKKSSDPAVVVLDEGGRFAVSLLSGHMGGANRLAERVAGATGAVPVITTATDTHGLPAIDSIAVAHGLRIENPEAIRHISIAVLESRPVSVIDPYGFLDGMLAPPHFQPGSPDEGPDTPVVHVDDRSIPRPPAHLVLRPPVLVAGIGCNRHTPAGEIEELLRRVMQAHELAMGSLCLVASVDAKKDEVGLLRLAETLDLPTRFFSPSQLSQVSHVPNPSDMVEKHIGAKSVCEAAAILGAGNGQLIVPKQKTRNVTVAIGRTSFTLSASAPAT